MRTTLALLLLVALPVAAQDLVRTERRSDPATATDLVFVGDGYRGAERDDFLRAVQGFVDVLEADAASPLRAARDAWNIHAVFVPSRERAQQRAGEPPRDTAFKLRPRAGDGMLEADGAAADAAATAAPDVDVVVIVGRFGFSFTPPRPSADYPPFGARVRIAEQDAVTLVHELGHARYGLGDEYADLQGPVPADERRWIAYFANLTCDPSGARFAGVAPPPYHEGGAHYREGVWRSERHCRMRASGAADQPFCAACRAQVDARPAVAPEAPSVTASGSALALAPPPGATRFDLVARPVAGGQALRLPLEGSTSSLDLAALLGPGAWDVEVRAANVAGSSAPTALRVDVGGPGPVVLGPGAPLPAGGRGLADTLRR